MYGRIIKFKFTIVLCLLLIAPVQIIAESVTFTAQVGDTILTIKGFTSPNSLVTFSEDNSIKGTVVSDSTGAFEKEFTAQDDGYHQITIFATDPEGRNTAALVQDIFLIEFQEYEINDLYLPPSISLNKAAFTFNKGEIIKVFGHSTPNSNMEIKIEGSMGRLSQVTSNLNGYYEYFANIDDLIPGDYVVSTTLKGSLNEDLSTSEQLSFQIRLVIEDVTPPGNPVAPIDQGEEIGGKCLYFYPKLCFFDKDGNGYIDQSSEFQKYFEGFVEYYSQMTSNIFDINDSNIVSVEDLSIVLYYTKPGAYQVLQVAENKDADIKFVGGKVLGSGIKDSDNNLNFFLNLAKNQIIIGLGLLIGFIILLFLKKIFYGDANEYS